MSPQHHFSLRSAEEAAWAHDVLCIRHGATETNYLAGYRYVSSKVLNAVQEIQDQDKTQGQDRNRSLLRASSAIPSTGARVACFGVGCLAQAFATRGHAKS